MNSNWFPWTRKRQISLAEYQELERKNKKLAKKAKKKKQLAKQVESLSVAVSELQVKSLSPVPAEISLELAKKQTDLLKEVRDIFALKSAPKSDAIKARHRRERWKETGYVPANTGTDGNITDT